MIRHHVRGFNSAIAIATPADIWSQGASYPFPAAAVATTIVSSDATDTLAGAGARTARVWGLDAAFNSVMEDVNLNGVTPVNLVNKYYRVNLVEIMSVGATGSNAGAVSVKQAAVVIQAVEIGIGRSRTAVFTIPASPKIWRLKRLYAAVTNAVAGAAIVNLMIRKNGGVWQIRSTIVIYGTANPNDQIELDIPLDPGDDVRLNATVTGAATAVNAAFELAAGSVGEISA